MKTIEELEYQLDESEKNWSAMYEADTNYLKHKIRELELDLESANKTEQYIRDIHKKEIQSIMTAFGLPLPITNGRGGWEYGNQLRQGSYDGWVSCVNGVEVHHDEIGPALYRIAKGIK